LRLLSPDVSQVARDLGVHPLVALLLHRRGYSSLESMAQFLNPCLEDLPSPWHLKDLDRAVALLSSLERGDSVLVYGDHDLDGVVSAVVLSLLLKEMGFRVRYYVPPRRRFSHGIRPEVVELAASRGFRAMVVADCGSGEGALVRRARELGLRVLVLDHHSFTEEDEVSADVYLNPMRGPSGFEGLCSAGLCWLLRSAVKGRFDEETMDLAALATLADVVPLLGANRVIAKLGMRRLCARPSMARLLQRLGIREPSWKDVSFRVVPRLNACAKLGDASDLVRFMLEGGSSSSERERLIDEFERLNLYRREQVERALGSLERALGEGGGVLVLREDLEPALAGSLAARVCQAAGAPVVVLAPAGGGLLRGSIRIPERSPLTCHQMKERLGDLCLKFGGHAKAGGFTVREEDLEELRTRLSDLGDLIPLDRSQEVAPEHEAVWSPFFVDRSLASALEEMAPFGVGNPRPVLLGKGLTLREVSRRGGCSALYFSGSAYNSTERKEVELWCYGDCRRLKLPPGGGPCDVLYSVGMERGSVRLEALRVVESGRR